MTLTQAGGRGAWQQGWAAQQGRTLAGAAAALADAPPLRHLCATSAPPLLFLSRLLAGWGLDFLLPHVLGYSRDSIAVIDAACMVHPPRPPGQPQSRMYALSLPRTPQQEWEHVLLKHNASGGPGQREWGGVPLAGWRPAVATSQVGGWVGGRGVRGIPFVGVRASWGRALGGMASCSKHQQQRWL